MVKPVRESVPRDIVIVLDRFGEAEAEGAATAGQGVAAAIRRSNYFPMSRRNAASSRIGTPRDLAFSSFEPGFSPATT